MFSHGSVLAVLFFGMSFAVAAQESTHATFVSEKSVDCGTKYKGKKQSTDILCQQYVVRTPTTEFTVRQPKPGNMDLVPLNTNTDFVLQKGKMAFKLNGKKFEYLVVSMSALQTQAQ
jgi:hypothetical protein